MLGSYALEQKEARSEQELFPSAALLTGRRENSNHSIHQDFAWKGQIANPRLGRLSTRKPQRSFPGSDHLGPSTFISFRVQLPCSKGTSTHRTFAIHISKSFLTPWKFGTHFFISQDNVNCTFQRKVTGCVSKAFNEISWNNSVDQRCAMSSLSTMAMKCFLSSLPEQDNTVPG